MNIDILDKLTGFQFEKFIGEFLTDIGFINIEITKKSGDFGVDVIAFLKDEKWVIQAKRWNKPVNLKAVQEVFTGKTFYCANHCMVISNQNFTNATIQLAKKCECKLVNRQDLMHWLNEKFKSSEEFLNLIEQKEIKKFKISTDKLIGEYLSIKEKLGRAPTLEEIDNLSQFSSSAYRKRWGSWTDFLKSIGETPIQQRNISKKELTDNFIGVKNKLNKIPTTNEMEKFGKYSISTYCRVFKSWNNFLREVNETPIKKHGIHKDEFIREFERVKSVIGHVPTTEEMRKHGKIAPNTYKRIFGSWSNFLKERGEKFQKRNISNDDLIKEYLKLKKLLKKKITQQDMDQYGEFSSTVYLRRFGSWNKFLLQIGDELSVNTNISDDNLITDYYRVKKMLNKPRLSASDILKEGKYALSTYLKQFGSWNNFLKRIKEL